MTSFFIKHPVISYILNAMIAIIGILSIKSLALREYPKIDIPVITVRAHYPNANVNLIESSITTPLEEFLGGIEGIDSITSTSSQERCDIKLTFKEGSSFDRSLILTREAINRAKCELPDDLRDPIVERVDKSTQGMPFMAISLSHPAMKPEELTHICNLVLKNALTSAPGVGTAQIWGQPYVMNVELDTKSLMTFDVNVDDVINSLKNAKSSFPSGKFQDRFPITLDNPLHTSSDFEKICVKSKNTPILLGHIANIQLDSNNKNCRTHVNKEPGIVIAIQKSNEANPLQLSKEVRGILKKIPLPRDLKINVIIDQSTFVNESIKSVLWSLLEAVIFVLITVFIFLKSFKASLIPLITVPISILGGISILALLGGSLNILTLLAMVLAIGLVVDDAIVIMEHISKLKEKNIKNPITTGAREMMLPVIAMTLTLSSVYVPIAFINGISGKLFVEFAIMLSSSVIVSGIVALTLSPNMCKKFLTKQENNAVFDKILNVYEKYLRLLLNWKYKYFLIACLFTSIFFLFNTISFELTPKEDRGMIGIWIPPNSSDSLDEFEEKIKKIESKLNIIDEKNSLLFVGNWGGCIFKELKLHHKVSAENIVKQLYETTSKIPSQDVWPWSYDCALPGIDSDASDSSSINIEICTYDDYNYLLEKADLIKKTLTETKKFKSVRHNLNMDFIKKDIVVDEYNLYRLNCNYKSMSNTFQAFFGEYRGANFTKDNIMYEVFLKTNYKPWSLDEIPFTLPNGKKIYLGTIAKLVTSSSADTLNHYNQMRSTSLTLDLLDNDKLGDLMPFVKSELSKLLGETDKFFWKGASKAKEESSSQVLFLFITALIFLYAVLSAQFENFIDPFIIILCVPLGLIGALLMMKLYSQTLNIYSQIGIITLFGLITKHGILMIEFTNKFNLDLKESIITACKERLRPILMTTAVMVFGSVPLLIGTSAGYESRKAIGVVLFGGLTFGTFLTLFILPIIIFYIKGKFKSTKNVELS